MNRRAFISQTLLAVAARRGLRAEAPPATFSLGFSLYGMKSLPISQALQTCAEIGYRNVELALNAGWPTEPKLLDPAARAQLRAELAQRGLTVSALMLNLSLAGDDAVQTRNLASLREAAQFAHDLSADAPPLIETTLGGKPSEWEQLREPMLARLRAWNAAAQGAGITIVVKAHAGNAVNSPDRLKWLVEQVPGGAIAVAFDYSHYQVAGLKLEDCLATLLPFTRFIHVKDAEGTPEQFHFLLPGQGHTDYVTYFRLLKAGGYAGPVVVEVSAQVFSQPGYDPVAAARECFTVLDRARRV